MPSAYLYIMHNHLAAQSDRRERRKAFFSSDIFIFLADPGRDIFKPHKRGLFGQIFFKRGARPRKDGLQIRTLYLAYGKKGVKITVEEIVQNGDGAVQLKRA